MEFWGIGEPVKHYFADELEKDVEMTGVQFIVKFLEQKGVTQVFGFPGTAILPFFDALKEQGRMRSINVPHEQTAIFMADGYARSTGKVGICAAGSGTGATNFLTGLYSAFRDSIPLIAFTSQCKPDLIENDAFQEIPIVEVVRPVTKGAYCVNKTTELPKVMREAWELATIRKGPVLVDIPLNVQTGFFKINLDDYLKIEMQEPEDFEQVTDSQLERVLDLLKEAETPCLILGEGGANESHSEELMDLAELLEIPVVSSLLGRDGFPYYHRLYSGMVGRFHQTPLGIKTIFESDLVVTLGVSFDSKRFDGIKELAKGCKLINIKTDKGKEHSQDDFTELVITSDVKSFLRKLNQFLRNHDYKPMSKVFERVESLQVQRSKLAPEMNSEMSSLSINKAIAEVRKGLRPDAVVALDFGLSQSWASQFEANESRSFLTTDCTEPMRWGLGAAMGAQLAYPERQVVSLLGNESLGASLQDLAAAVNYNIPVAVIVINSKQGHLGALNFVAEAKVIGVEAELIENPEQITDALARAFSVYRPYLIEILVDEDTCLNDRFIREVKEVS